MLSRPGDELLCFFWAYGIWIETSWMCGLTMGRGYAEMWLLPDKAYLGAVSNCRQCIQASIILPEAGHKVSIKSAGLIRSMQQKAALRRVSEWELNKTVKMLPEEIVCVSGEVVQPIVARHMRRFSKEDWRLLFDVTCNSSITAVLLEMVTEITQAIFACVLEVIKQSKEQATAAQIGAQNVRIMLGDAIPTSFAAVLDVEPENSEVAGELNDLIKEEVLQEVKSVYPGTTDTTTLNQQSRLQKILCSTSELVKKTLMKFKAKCFGQCNQTDDNVAPKSQEEPDSFCLSSLELFDRSADIVDAMFTGLHQQTATDCTNLGMEELVEKVSDSLRFTFSETSSHKDPGRNQTFRAKFLNMMTNLKRIFLLGPKADTRQETWDSESVRAGRSPERSSEPRNQVGDKVEVFSKELTRIVFDHFARPFGLPEFMSHSDSVLTVRSQRDSYARGAHSPDVLHAIARDKVTKFVLNVIQEAAPHGTHDVSSTLLEIEDMVGETLNFEELNMPDYRPGPSLSKELEEYYDGIALS